MIATAAREAWAARQNAARTRQRRPLAKRRLDAIDGLLDVVEIGRLAGERRIDKRVRARIALLPLEVGLPLPQAVARARNSRGLHRALLDWQEQVLDHVVPMRRAYYSSDQEFDSDASHESEGT